VAGEGGLLNDRDYHELMQTVSSSQFDTANRDLSIFLKNASLASAL
jgi:hypothetical protein